MDGVSKLVGTLFSGCGLRINEVVLLRVQNIGYRFKYVMIHDGNSKKTVINTNVLRQGIEGVVNPLDDL